jgi:hypothetical protein
MALVAKKAGADGGRPDFVIKPVRNRKAVQHFCDAAQLVATRRATCTPSD